MEHDSSWTPQWPEEQQPSTPGWVQRAQFGGGILVLSLYTTLACLPIVTLPAAWAAAVGTARRIMRGDASSTRSVFFRLFRENFWKSTILGGLFFVLAAIATLDVRLVGGRGGRADGLWLIGLVYLMVITQLYPLMVHVDMPLGRLLTTAFKLVFFRIQWTALAVGSLLIMWKGFVHIPLLLIVVFPGVSAYVVYWCFTKKIEGLEIVPPDS